MRIDQIEAAADSGATKLYGSILVEATGDLQEWTAPVRDANGSITSYAYDQTSADVYGYTVTLIGTPTLTPVWLQSSTDTGVNGELEARVISGDAAAFTVTTEGATLSDTSIRGTGGGSVSISSSTSVTAGSNSYQRNRIVFGALTQSGYIYSVTVDGNPADATPGTKSTFTSTGTDISSVLQGLKTAIEAAHPAVSGVGGIAVTVDAGAAALSLQARAANTPFTVSAVTVTEDYVGVVPSALTDPGTTPVTAAGYVAAQTSTVTFGSAQTVVADQRYSVMLNGHDYAVTVGDNASVWVNTTQSVSIVAKEWATTTALGSVAASAVIGSLGTATVTASTTTTPLTIDVAGWTEVTGATYTITINGTNFAQIAAAGETDASLAGKLKTLIDGTGTDTYAATLSGTTISVTLQAGGRVTTAASASQTPPSRTIDVSGLTAEADARYTLNITGITNGVSVVSSSATLATLATQLTAALNVAGTGLTAALSGNIITLTDATGGADPLTATISTTVQRVQPVAESGRAAVTASSAGGQRVSLTGLPARVDMQYTLTVGTTPYLVTLVSGDTLSLATVADKLVTAIGATATATKSTVTADWSSVNTALDVLLQKGEPVTVLQARPLNLSGVKTATAATYTLTIGTDSASFSALVGMSGGDRARGLAADLATKFTTKYSTSIDGDVLWINSGAASATITLTSGNTLDTLVVETVDQAARRLTLVANASNTAFTLNSAAITPWAKLAAQSINTTQAAATGQNQITAVSFAGTVAADVLYSVVLNGKTYTVRSGDNLGLKLTGLGAQDSISLKITDEAGVDITNATHRLWLANVQATPAGVSLPRVLDLSGLPVAAGYVYTVTAGSGIGTFTAVAASTGVSASTSQDVLAGLVANLNLASSATGVTATGLTATVASAWVGSGGTVGVLDALDALLTADNQVTATASGTTLTLTGANSGTSFTVNAVYASSSTALAGDSGVPVVKAGKSSAQTSKIIFAAASTNVADQPDQVLKLVDGVSFAVNMGPRSYSVTIGSSGVTADWSSILTTLGGLIQTGENAAVAAGIAASTTALPYTGTQITVTANATARSLTLVGLTQDIGFNLASTVVSYNGNRAVVGGVDQPGTTPAVTATTSAKQQSSVDFAGSTLSGTTSYTVSVNGVAQTVKVGGAVTQDWPSILGALASKLTATGVVTASVSGSAINLQAVALNTAFRLSAYASDAGVTSLTQLGDYVLVLPIRPAGPYSLGAAGSLTVVNLPTLPGETINLSAGNSLVVVSPIAVGTGTSGGAVTLSAGNSLTLGGKLTAGALTATASGDLSMKTEVGVMNITLNTLSGATSPSNLTIEQDAAGSAVAALNINTLVMSGGNVSIIADGDVIINSITGSVGSLRIVSTGGNVWIKSMDGASAAASMTIETTGSVTLGNRAAWATGVSDTTVATGSLDIVAGGAIQVFEKDALVINQIRSTSKAAVTVLAGGATTLNAAIDAASQNLSLRTTSGLLTLNAPVTSGGGNILLDGAAGLTMSELGDISSAGGTLTLKAGTSAMTMAFDTLVDAGAGQLSLDAVGYITIGQLRSSFTGALNIIAGGISAQADGVVDILAPNASLKITSSGGIGANGNPLETKVKTMDLWNTDIGTSAIVVEQTGSVDVNQLKQAASGGTDLRTIGGSINVLDLGGALADGIHATSGSVSLYAGGGAVNLVEDITTTGGGVSVVAEQGNITLDSGIRVVGGQSGGIDLTTGNILLRAANGSILTASSAAQWLKDGAAFDADAIWALVNGRYTVDVGTGQIIAKDLTASESFQHNLVNGATLRAANGAYLQTTGGNLTLQASGSIGEKLTGFTYSPLSVLVDAQTLVASSSSRANVSVLATDAIAVGSGAVDASGSKGGATDVISMSGKQSINSSVDAAGQDITIAANQVNITQSIRSVDATLTIKPLDPRAAIVVGDMLLNSNKSLTLNANVLDTQTLNLDRGDIGNLGAGFGQIVIGTDGNSNPIYFTGANGSSGLVFNDPLKLYSNGAGGEIYFGTDLTAKSLILFGSGHTTTFTDTGSAYEFILGTQAIYNDSIRIDGDVGIQVTSGSITLGQTGLGHKMFGDANNRTGIADSLTLSAAAGDITFNVAVGIGPDPDFTTKATENLKGLTIASAINVNFKDTVTVDGDITINATGKVSFAAGVTLLNGGKLTINGATEIVFGADSSLDLQGGGTLLLEADEIQLPTINPGVITGTGTVTLRQTNLTQQIAVGSPYGVTDTTSILSLSSAELSALSPTFSEIIIGHQAVGGHADVT